MKTETRHRSVAGFTLIELLIAVTVAAILTAIAVASYGFATVKTRRGAAKGCLTEGAQYMERYYATHFSYSGASLPDCSVDGVDKYYSVAFATGMPTESAYRIEATPLGSQASSDSRCGTLSLDNTGTKGANDVDACW
jgi:type IV pilus assembly protein PilE